ncbi:MAG: ATP-dependent protease LonB [Candidatus Thermoplasmatota archaeon]|nr:ATP-dependent protease LonB [Candidatus Thermoplasmatota archaeon]
MEISEPREWVKTQKFESTADIKVPETLMDQVIGQDVAVELVKKAAKQKRHMMIIGDPGTGKSMLAKAMTEFLPKEDLQDIMVYYNSDDPNMPKIRVVPSGKGREIVRAEKERAAKEEKQRESTSQMIIFGVIIAVLAYTAYDYFVNNRISLEVILMGAFFAIMMMFLFRSPMKRTISLIPKLIVSHTANDMPPFVDATASHSGALLGDIRHDPFQSGGLETPQNQLVEAGAIHRAHRGVLYVDEINTLRLESQQQLLTAIQEKKFPITGQSERSFGSMVKTEAVPCDFVLVCAGNLDALNGMHPALRSRIRGYGYEVYVNSNMDDNEENRAKLIRFVAQEVSKDGRIPPLDKQAVGEIIHEAQRRAGEKGKLSLRLRELGGLIRAAGDIAIGQKSKLATSDHVLAAKGSSKPLEQQVADRYLEHRKEYLTFKTTGSAIGAVNGLAVMGGQSGMSEYSGIVMPIVAEVTPAASSAEGKVIATGKLGVIAREAVQNVSALLKKYIGKDITNHDVHIQFIGTYEGVEGDSASVSVASAVISALEGIPLDQGVAMTGSLSIRGEILPIGGVTAKIEAAALSGIKKVLIPESNMRNVLVENHLAEKIKIVPVKNLRDIMENIAVGPKKDALIKKLAAIVPE